MYLMKEEYVFPEKNKMGKSMKSIATKNNIKSYVVLHLAILMFSFTSVFTKMASNAYREHGLLSGQLLLFLFLMFANCFLYAIVWQKVIKKFDLNVAYANKSVYLIWSQIWAVFIFQETLTLGNVIGLILVFIGVLVVQDYE